MEEESDEEGAIHSEEDHDKYEDDVQSIDQDSIAEVQSLNNKDQGVKQTNTKPNCDKVIEEEVAEILRTSMIEEVNPQANETISKFDEIVAPRVSPNLGPEKGTLAIVNPKVMKFQKENINKLVIPKPMNNQLAHQNIAHEEENNTEKKGGDLDKASAT